MGKRLGRQCRRSLYTGDPRYIPYPHLKFRNSQTETDFQRETYRFAQSSLRALAVSAAVLTVLLWVKGLLGFLSTLVCLGGVAGSVKAGPYGPWAVRLVWIVPELVLGGAVAGPKVAESFAALLPSLCTRTFQTDLFTLKHWSTYLFLALTEALVFSLTSTASSLHLTCIVLALACVLSLFEREFRDLWVVYDSYHRSEALYYRLFEESPNAIFIVTSGGKVVAHNRQARKLVQKLKKPLTLMQTGSFQDLFAEEFTTRFQDMIAAAMKGEEEEEELFLKPLPSKLDADVLCDLAIGVKFQPTIWKNGNCVKVTCSDISPFMSRRLFLMQLYKGVYGSIYAFLRNLQKLYQCNEAIQSVDMYKYNKIASTLKNTLVLQSYFLGRIELKKENYHIKNEITSQVNFAHIKAEDKGVILTTSRDTAMPLSVLGDKSKHNQLLAVLLDFALEQADKGTEVALHCSVALEDGQALAVYRVMFLCERMEQKTLDKLFTGRQDGSRKTLQQIVGITAEYGVGVAIFDTLLAVMRGCVKDSLVVSEEHCNQVIIAYE